MYSNRNDCDKYVFRMQKTHKSKGGIVWGNIKKKKVSLFILHLFITSIEQLSYMANCGSYELRKSSCPQSK